MRKTPAQSRQKQSKATLIIIIFAILIFLGGAAVFLYPTISNMLAELNQSDVIQQYNDTLTNADEEFYEDAWETAQIYNDNLAGDPVRDPFVPGSGFALPQNYLECLNINGDGVMGYIEIPRIDVRLPIYHGSSEEVLQQGVGHIESTALPIGGDYTHAVLTGHRGLPSAKLFTDLDRLEIGDQFYIHVLDEVLAYEIDEINTVLPDQLQELQPIEGRDLVTLATCTPYGVNTHRMLVRGTRVPYIPEEADEYRQTAGLVSVFGVDIRMQYLGAAVGGVVLIVILIIVLLARRRRRKKGKKNAGKHKKA